MKEIIQPMNSASPDVQSEKITSSATNDPQPKHEKSGTTGPRSELGKKHSSRNAIKHGIFSEVTLIPGESRAQYRLLLKELGDDLQPVGRMEELLVEKRASIFWRYRRFLVAEGAEIRWGKEFIKWDERRRETQEAEAIETRVAHALNPNNPYASRPGLIHEIRNSVLLERCVELLGELFGKIQAGGFNSLRDEAILDKIYGFDRHQHGTLKQRYSVWEGTAKVSENERQRHGYANPEKCKEHFLSELSKEFDRLQGYRQELVRIESERLKLEILRRNVPEPERLDRLLSAEASLERELERNLNQLERLQRLRRGLPVAPRLEVSVTS